MQYNDSIRVVLSSLLLQNMGKKGSQLWRGTHEGSVLSLCFSLKMGHRVTLPHWCSVPISRVVLRNRKHHPRAKLSGLSPCSLSLTLQPGQSPQGLVVRCQSLGNPKATPSAKGYCKYCSWWGTRGFGISCGNFRQHAQHCSEAKSAKK